MDCQIKYSLLDTVLKEQKNHKNLITAVKINNVLRDVQTQVTPEDKVEFIDMTTEDGVQAYQRSILFIMMAAVNMLYPDKEVVVEHSVNNGIYCELLPKGDLTLEMVGKIQEKMFEFVSKAKDIKKCILPREDAVALFRESQQIAKSKLLESLKHQFRITISYDHLILDIISKTLGTVFMQKDLTSRSRIYSGRADSP